MGVNLYIPPTSPVVYIPKVTELSTINYLKNNNGDTSNLVNQVKNILNDYTPSSSRVSSRQSEKDMYNLLKTGFKDNENLRIVPQPSFLERGKGTYYGKKDSVRFDSGIFEQKEFSIGTEIKNYKVGNYSSMTSVIGNQAIKRNNYLPNKEQIIVIDARGQSLGKTLQQQKELQQKIINDIVRKSNGTVKPENIIIWK